MPTVTSADGTTISYLTVGHGPGLILLPGALATAQDFAGFARALGTWFTVHTLDRRGRGGSGPQGADYTAERECEDIAAVQQATGATLLVGHSFGGFLALEALAAGQRFDRAAVYEPGVHLEGHGPVTLTWTDRCRRELSAGRQLAAFLTFIRGVNPRTTGRVPRPLLTLIILAAIRRPERRQKYALLAGTILEHEEAARLANQPQRYAGITTPMLLMTGKDTESTAAGGAPARLAALLPAASLTGFPTLDHLGPEKAPDTVAAAIATFFQETKGVGPSMPRRA
ncbi:MULTISPECIES: alpha/beta fold hydrolase [Pseudofrankia]|uniref:alpha/beta fold hydrolase n=1 Tax=Pseudofrankia TaxID=2994363 RepID=UPI000234B57E|nr:MULTISPECIES: alpha/beta hydrolase [Pseudofrankia]OHV35175.1 alpha/beta hydrolase [Pseudofrankia sp. EUN1h]